MASWAYQVSKATGGAMAAGFSAQNKLNIYLCDYRIDTAESRLGVSGVSVTDIAYDCGFPTLSSFHRLFRKQAGMSPREFRKQQDSTLQ